MKTITAIQAIEARQELLLEVLKHVSKNQPGHFSWEERMAIHQERAAGFRALEELENYDPEKVAPDAVHAILRVTWQDHSISDALDEKVLKIAYWLQIKTQQQ